jgi:hypothetical protein
MRFRIVAFSPFLVSRMEMFVEFLKFINKEKKTINCMLNTQQNRLKLQYKFQYKLTAKSLTQKFLQFQMIKFIETEKTGQSI